jgi:hypothetical protein
VPVSSPVDVANLALGHLGEASITSLSEDTVTARACNLHFNLTRDALLRQHRWNFAQARVVLSRLVGAPAFQWSSQYTLPSDCLRVLEVNGSEDGDVISEPWVIEGRVILTNATSVNLVYIKSSTNVDNWDGLFIEALALKLAAKISESVRGSTGKTEELIRMLEQVTAPLARRVDANEGRRRKGMIPMNSLFLRSRDQS